MTDSSKFENLDFRGRKKLDTAKRDLQMILNQIEEFSLPSRASKLWQFDSLIRSKKSGSRKIFFWFFIIFTIFFYCVGKNFLTLNIRRKCWIENPGLFQKLFRPPEDCSICQDVQQVEKLEKVDPVTFEERYAYSGHPVVIKDAMKDWSATETFSYSFFKKLYEGREANCQFFPYKSGFESLKDVFNMSTERALQKPGTKPWYVGWSNCDEKIGTILRDHYRRPYFLPSTSETEKTDWIFMGSSGYGAPMHVDDVAYPSWQAQITGTKLWILEPPRECHYKCNRLEIMVQPGEIIILDTNRWYHQTIITSDEMSITIGAEYD